MQPSPSAANRGQNNLLTKQDVLAAAQRLPTTAQVFAQVNRMLDDPEASLDDIAELVRLEPVLSFRVLQLANGAFYGFRTPCSDLNEAITRLGFREVNRLVGMVAAQQLCANFLSVYGISGDLFWSDSLCSALACEWLTHRHAFGDVRTAYTAGLLRSVGKVTLHRILVDRPMLWKSYLDSGEGKPLLLWEKEAFGLSSLDAAVFLMQSWKMPQHLLDGIKLHCQPSGDEPLPYLMHLAAVVSAQINGALPGETTYWQNHDAALVALEMDAEMLQACAREVETMFERVKRAINV
ncbi:HDOD domain protein [mine drainage metagenome]|uniref:HDOD domain protein n=1 Tax=mine drainage metagenome TaxID=410659 RepID=A0A1J5TAT7_9ZZZZ